MSIVLERALAARDAGKILIVAGLRSATPKEISSYLRELREQNIKCRHVTKNLGFNGVLRIYPTTQVSLIRK
jgi:hypothetical protein